MKPHLSHTLQMTIGYGKLLVADIPDDKLSDQPVPGVVMNHAAWVLGHIAFAAHSCSKMLGRSVTASADENELFGMQSSPKADRSSYPSKDELAQLFERALTEAGDALNAATPEQLATPSHPKLAPRFPTIGDFVIFILTTHTGTHLGQLSMWRRASGMPRVM